MIDHLLVAAFADGAHEAGNPRTGDGVTERHPTIGQDIQHELEMLEFLNGDGVEVGDSVE